MESHAFDHNLHSADSGNSLYSDIANVQNLHSHNLDINGDHFNNDLNNNNYDINQNQYDYSQNHGLNNDHYQNNKLIYNSNQGLNQIDHNQFISDYQQPNFSNTMSEVSVGNHPQSFSHDQYLVHDTQRLGSATFTPSSPSDISQNKEVIFKDADGYEQSGTVMKTNSDDTYTIQTSNGTYEKVPYHNIEKYGSK